MNRPDLKRSKAYLRLAKRKYQRGRIVPIDFDNHQHTCKNCGWTFEGNYCNNCGQTKKTRRITYKTAIQNFLGGLTNIDNGFFSTCMELFIRPGFMIKDYIEGRRVLYFRPFQMLFILTTTYLVLLQLVPSHTITRTITLSDGTTTEETYEVDEDIDDLKETTSNIFDAFQNVSESIFERSPFFSAVFKKLGDWLTSEQTLEFLLFLPAFAVATRWAFRKDYRGHKLNLVELIFVRTYASCQIVIASIILLPFLGKEDDGIPWWLHFFFSFWIYYQLYGFGWWKTLRKTALMYIYSLIMIILIAIIVITLIILVAIAAHTIINGGYIPE